jgi:hypothetical protein
MFIFPPDQTTIFQALTKNLKMGPEFYKKACHIRVGQKLREEIDFL